MHRTIQATAGVAIATLALCASAASSGAGITDAQRARLAERLRLAEQVVRVVDADARSATVTAERRQWLLDSLYLMPLEKLRAMGTPPTFDAAAAAVAAAGAQKTSTKALGDAASDLVYRPITPCRYIDTRNVPQTLPATFNLGTTGNVYGGSAACNIVTASGVANADDFAAVSMNIAIVNPNFAPGFLGARPNGSVNSTALVNWYQVGPIVQASNAGVVTTAQGAGDEIQFFGTQTQFVVDVMGVFTKPDATPLDCTTVTTAGTGTFPTGGDSLFFNVPTVCPSGYTGVAVGCEYGPTAAPGLALISVGVADPLTGFLTCVWRNETGTTLNYSNFHTHTRCCRVPGRNVP